MLNKLDKKIEVMIDLKDLIKCQSVNTKETYYKFRNCEEILYKDNMLYFTSIEDGIYILSPNDEYIFLLDKEKQTTDLHIIKYRLRIAKFKLLSEIIKLK